MWADDDIHAPRLQSGQASLEANDTAAHCTALFMHNVQRLLPAAAIRH